MEYACVKCGKEQREGAAGQPTTARTGGKPNGWVCEPCFDKVVTDVLVQWCKGEISPPAS